MGILDRWTDGRIETAVELLLGAAEDEGCLERPTWSLAELRPGLSDLDRLRLAAEHSVSSWALILRRDFSLPGQISLPERLGTLPPSHKECLGLLLLALLAGLSRRHGNTEACFRPSRGKLSPAVEQILFQSGTVHRQVQVAIEEACKRFRLRLAGPEHSVQRWYLTVRMHEGIPENGLEHRLPSWLHGLGLPLHLHLMLGEGPLGSPSLRGVWQKLMQFSRKKIDRERIRRELEGSVWFHRQDLDGLLDAIEAFQPVGWGPGWALRPGAGEGAGPAGSEEEEVQALEARTRLQLRTSGGRPALLAHPEPGALSRDLTGDRYEVHVEGRWRGALLRQGQEYLWMDGSGLEVPFRTTCAVQLMDEEDMPVAGERWLQLWDGEEVLVFGEGGLPEDGALQPSRGYWLVAPRGATTREAPAGVLETAREECTLVWLPPNWTPQVAVELAGETIWSPGATRRERPPWLEHLQLDENPMNPGEFEVIRPSWVTLRSARAQGQTLRLQGDRLFLPATQAKEPLVDVHLVVQAGAERWLVSRRVVVRAALLLAREEGAWREVRDEELNLRTLESSTVRVCAPRALPGLFFGDALGRRVPQRAGVLAGLPGLGERLALGALHPRGELHGLGVTVVNRGLVEQGEVARDRLTLTLNRELKPRNEHRLLLWFQGRPPELHKITWRGATAEISLPGNGQGLRVAALLFKETWLGGWWSPSWPDVVASHPDPREVFLLLRWLRLPILSAAALPTLRAHIERHPSEALIAWGVVPRGEPEQETAAQRTARLAAHQIQLHGTPLEPTSLPGGELWRLAVRSVFFGTRIRTPGQVLAMFEQVHGRLLHQPTAQALMPWGNLLLAFSAWWPADACQHEHEKDRSSAQGRRSQWRNAFRFLDPQQTITDRKRRWALDDLKDRAAETLEVPRPDLEQWLKEALQETPQGARIPAALHQDPFRRLVATMLLDGGPR